MVPAQVFLFHAPAWPVNVGWTKTPGFLPTPGFVLIAALASAIVRIWYLIDKWVCLLGFISVACADIPVTWVSLSQGFWLIASNGSAGSPRGRAWAG
jgi:hypothetical protein